MDIYTDETGFKYHEFIDDLKVGIFLFLLLFTFLFIARLYQCNPPD